MDTSIVTNLVKKFSAGAKKVQGDLADIGKSIKKMKDDFSAGFNEIPWENLLSVKNLEKATKDAETKLLTARKRLLDAVGLGSALYTPIKLAVQFDQSMQGLEGVIDAPMARIKELRKFALKTSGEIAISAKDIVELMSSASQAGVASDELEAFTKYAANAAVAFGMASTEIGERFAKLKNVYKLNQAGIEDLGDATTQLSNRMAAKASEITNFTNSAAGAGTLLNMNARQVAAFGTAMIASGTAPETAARSLSSLSTRILTGGKQVDAAFDMIGVSRKRLQEELQADAPGAMTKLFETLQQHPKGLEAIVNIAGKNYADGFLKLTKNTELLKQAFELTAEPAAYAGSTMQKAEKQADSAADKFQLFKNRLDNLGVAIGDQLLPATTQMTDAIGGALVSIIDWIEKNPVLAGGIIKASAAFYALNVAMSTLSFISAAVKLKFVNLIGTFLKFDKSGRNVATGWRMIAGAGRLLSSSARLLGRGLLSLFTFIRAGGGIVNIFLSSLRSAAPIFANFIQIIKLVATAIRLFGISMMTTPIGWLIAGIALLVGAGYLLYQNWGTVVGAISSLWSGFTSWIGGIFNNITSAFGDGVINGIMNLLLNFSPLGIISNAINKVIEWLFGVDLKEVGGKFIGSFWEGLQEKWHNLVNWLRDAIVQITGWLPGWVKDKLGLNFETNGTFNAGEADTITASPIAKNRPETLAISPIKGQNFDAAHNNMMAPGALRQGSGPAFQNKMTNNNTIHMANTFNVTTNDGEAIARTVMSRLTAAQSAAFTGVE